MFQINGDFNDKFCNMEKLFRLMAYVKTFIERLKFVKVKFTG